MASGVLYEAAKGGGVGARIKFRDRSHAEMRSFFRPSSFPGAIVHPDRAARGGSADALYAQPMKVGARPVDEWMPSPPLGNSLKTVIRGMAANRAWNGSWLAFASRPVEQPGAARHEGLTLHEASGDP
jgi:hypothetical protein